VKPHLQVIAVLSRIVPRHARADWRQEWEAELTYYELHHERVRAGGHASLTLFTRSLGAVVDALCLHATLYERMWRKGNHMSRPQRALSLMIYALATAGLAGINLVWTVDDTPLIAAMQEHAALSIFWHLVAWGAIVAFGAAAVAGLPVLGVIAARAWRDRRWDTLGRLAVPPLTATLVLIWLTTAFAWSGSHWMPLPWDIAGDWTAPANWPSTQTRWLLGGVTSGLLVTAIAASAVSLTGAIARSELPMRLVAFLKGAAAALAGAIGLMAIAVAAWGILANDYASAALHSRLGGALGSTILVSWVASSTLFLAATAFAVRGAVMSAAPFVRD
jgi:hypothetical protein